MVEEVAILPVGVDLLFVFFFFVHVRVLLRVRLCVRVSVIRPAWCKSTYFFFFSLRSCFSPSLFMFFSSFMSASFSASTSEPRQRNPPGVVEVEMYKIHLPVGKSTEFFISSSKSVG